MMMKEKSVAQLIYRIQLTSKEGTLGYYPGTRKLPESIEAYTIEDFRTVLTESFKCEVEKRRVPLLDFSPEVVEKIEIISRCFTTEDCVRGLFLYGSIGPGKTILMKALYGVLRAAGCTDTDVVLTKATDLFDEYKMYHERLPSRYECMLKARYLFLDDLGAEPVSCQIYGVNRLPIQDVIYERYDRQRMTIVSSNLDKPTLRDRYGTRMYDRMVEMMLPLYFSGPSYRRQHGYE